jgi:hypothetical protein
MFLKNLPTMAARMACALFCADILTMLVMNIFRLDTQWLPFLFFALLLILGWWIFQGSLVQSGNPATLSGTEQAIVVAIVLAAGVLFACARLPYLLEGHLHHLVGPVVYDDTWHFQEINSLVNSPRYPAQFNLVPHSYFSLYYAAWMLIAALYLAIPVAGFTIKAAFAVGCAIYQVLICLTLLHVGISKARSRRQLYWAIYLIGCWAGLESFFALIYYLRHNALWLLVSETPVHFPTFASSAIWAVHHLSAATALILCWFIWDNAKSRSGRSVFCCAVLIAFAFYGSVFVFMGALPFGIFVAWRSARENWKAVAAVICLSAVLIWPLLWLYLGKTSDVRFLFPFIASVPALLPAVHMASSANFATGMWTGFLLFLILLCINFVPYSIAMGRSAKCLTISNWILAFIAIAFLVSTYFIGFREGDNYASRGFLIPIFVFAWICAGLLASIRPRKWIAVLLLLGAFGSIHEVAQTYKRAVHISHGAIAGEYDAKIFAVNRDRSIRSVQPQQWNSGPLIYDVEKFVVGGKSSLVTADRQLECPGPRGIWRWQQIPAQP